MPKRPRDAKRDAVSDQPKGKLVRLELSPEDHERLRRAAKRRGLNMASYCRQAVLGLMERDEAGGVKVL
jgi:hypothetical protein